MSDCVGEEGGELGACRAFRVVLPDGRAYWTVIDDRHVKVGVADRFLFFTSGRVSPSRMRVLIVPALAWHTFKNTGDGPLRTIAADEGADLAVLLPDESDG